MARILYHRPRLQALIFLCFSFVLIAVMVFVFGKVSKFWTAHQNIKVAFTTAESLKPGAHVRYNGVDIGVVKEMTIIRLDEATLAKFPPLTKSELDYLPLTDERRLAFKSAPEDQLAAKLKEEILGRTMIGLTLEVDQMPGRYRVNDAVHVAASIMEDPSLEIATGTGSELKPGDDVWILGQSGDFFTKLSRSVEEVKSVMAYVTDIVGAEERQSMRKALGHSQKILAGFDQMSNTMKTRLAQSTKKMDLLKTSSTSDMKRLGKTFGQLQPEAKRLLDRLAVLQKDLGGRFDELNKVLDLAKAELNALTGAVARDMKYVQDKAAPDLKLLHENLTQLYDSAPNMGEHMKMMRYYAGRAMMESQPEFVRIQSAFANTEKNMRSLKYIREQTDKLIGMRENGESNYYSHVDLERTWARVARMPRDAMNELLEWRPLIPNPPDPGQRPKVSDLDRIYKKLDTFTAGLEQARDVAAKVMLPPYKVQPGNPGQKPFPRKSGIPDVNGTK